MRLALETQRLADRARNTAEKFPRDLQLQEREWREVLLLARMQNLKYQEIARLLAEEIRRGEFLLSAPLRRLPRKQSMSGLKVRDANQREVRR